MKKNITYEEAVNQLESIVSKMENNQLNIDELSEQLKTAQALIKMCNDKLTQTEQDIKKILEDGKK